MNIKPPNEDASVWFLPAEPEDVPVPGYEEWLAAEIEAAQAEIRAGRVVTLEQVRKEFGLE